MSNILIGVAISLVGHMISALGLNLQRYAHTIDVNVPVYKKPAWFYGLICMGLCEVFNFLALSFAPASIVAPLGAFSVVCNALFGHLIFSEAVGANSMMALGLIALGSVFVVLFGPNENKDISVELFTDQLKKPTTVSYFSLTVVVMVTLAIKGGDNLYANVGIASLSAGMTMTLTKAMAMFVKLSVTGNNQMAKLLPYGIIVFIVAAVVLQLRYINKAMENHKSFIVSALYFVLLTTMTILNSTILFGDLRRLSAISLILFSSGCIVVMYGVWILSNDTSEEEEDSEMAPLKESRLDVI